VFSRYSFAFVLLYVLTGLLIGSAFIADAHGSALIQSAYLKASNAESGDEFGTSIAADGQTILVGAQWEDSAATGVDGDQADGSAAMSGAGYVFRRQSDGAWAQEAYLKASNTESGDRFGFSVAVSGDLAAVGAFSEDSGAAGINGDGSDNSVADAGAVYIYERNQAGQWAPQAYIKASNPDENDQFGMALALSGNTLVVSAEGEDSAAAGINGDQSDNSASAAGAVYVFVRDEQGQWSQQAYLKASNAEASDRFGTAVAIDGDIVLVGAKFEQSNALGINGDQSNNLADNAGAAYVFARDEQGQWTQQAYLKASNTDAADQFGFSVAVSGQTALVGAFRESSAVGGVDGDQQDNAAQWAGAAYVYVRDTDQSWHQQAYLKASNPDEIDYFASSVALSGDAAVIGAYTEDSAATGVDGDQDDNSAADAGAAYAFVRGPNGGWSQLAYLKASNTDTFDGFGRAVALSGATIVAAAAVESSSASGVDGEQDNNDAGGSGAAYAFTLPDRTLSLTTMGQGQIISDPAGIECPSACSAGFPYGISVELTATAAPGWRLASWAGAAAGCGTASQCVVALDQNRSVGARFERAIDRVFRDRFERRD
jgi:hypothetical protein